MDNLTHGLVGAALARAGVGRGAPLATATLVLAANAPDVDVLAYVRGPWFAIAFRRGITHGLPAQILLPFAVAAAMLAWDRRVRRRRRPDAEPARFRSLLFLSFVGVLTHPALDWMNTYGMRWGLPFDGGWSYGDSLFIVDPWLWLALGSAAALVPRRSRLGGAAWGALALAASVPVLTAPVVPAGAKAVWASLLAAAVLARLAGRPASPGGGVRLARGLVGVAAAYVALMVGADHLARADVRARLADAGFGEPDALVLSPLPADPLGADVVARVGETYVPGSYRWTRSPRARLEPERAWRRVRVAHGVPAAAAAGAVAQARLHPDVAHYLVWSRLPMWSVAAAADGWRVGVEDARYAGRGGGLGGPTVVVPAGP